jgi:hypothetical protein
MDGEVGQCTAASTFGALEMEKSSTEYFALYIFARPLVQLGMESPTIQALWRSFSKLAFRAAATRKEVVTG